MPVLPHFSGGWGVAYDVIRTRYTTPVRSAYGVANADTSSESALHSWDKQFRYVDGSYVTYGHEGDDPEGKMLSVYFIGQWLFL